MKTVFGQIICVVTFSDEHFSFKKELMSLRSLGIIKQKGSDFRIILKENKLEIKVPNWKMNKQFCEQTENNKTAQKKNSNTNVSWISSNRFVYMHIVLVVFFFIRFQLWIINSSTFIAVFKSDLRKMIDESLLSFCMH